MWILNLGRARSNLVESHRHIHQISSLFSRAAMRNSGWSVTLAASPTRHSLVIERRGPADQYASGGPAPIAWATAVPDPADAR